MTVLAERSSVMPSASGLSAAMAVITKNALAATPLIAAKPEQIRSAEKVLSSAILRTALYMSHTAKGINSLGSTEIRGS